MGNIHLPRRITMESSMNEEISFTTIIIDFILNLTGPLRLVVEYGLRAKTLINMSTF